MKGALALIQLIALTGLTAQTRIPRMEVHAKANIFSIRNSQALNVPGYGLSVLRNLPVSYIPVQLLLGAEYNQTAEILNGPKSCFIDLLLLRSLTIPVSMRYSAGSDFRILFEAGAYTNLLLDARTIDAAGKRQIYSSARSADFGPRICSGLSYADEEITYYFRLECMSGLRNLADPLFPTYNRSWSLVLGLGF